MITPLWLWITVAAVKLIDYKLVVRFWSQIRPIYIGKNQNPQNLVFCCCTVYTARKTHNIQVFWHEKRMREKTRSSDILGFLVSGAHARLLSTFDRT